MSVQKVVNIDRSSFRSLKKLDDQKMMESLRGSVLLASSLKIFPRALRWAPVAISNIATDSLVRTLVRTLVKTLDSKDFRAPFSG